MRVIYSKPLQKVRHSDSKQGHADRGNFASMTMQGLTLQLRQELLTLFGWEVLDHPPYSPDLATSDFYLFRHLKHHLGGNHYNGDEDMKTTELLVIHAGASFNEEGIQNQL
ncbi:hypothetical protein AVEN_7313-1 [Araneus ventricosus]|uniref:Histone-lysine N-methyltransferase SETMAR n=1 Tax=Araneus ventricosus TaxID=182803 RepID=A0A4Y2VTY6_ARAVE|nr:hypothetical protein AVEN_7313-1 [Araneus ventricosus]